MPSLSLGLGLHKSRVFMAGGGGAPLIPQSGLSLWLKADAGVSLDGSNVSDWADQSTNDINALSIVPPTFVSNAKNGKPAISFNGTNIMAAAPVFSGSNSRTFFVVYYTDNVDTTSNSIAGQSNLDEVYTGAIFFIQARNDALDSSPYLAGYSADLSGPPYANNQWVIATADYDGTTANLYANGTLYNSAELALDTWDTGNCFTIGCIYDLGSAGYAEFFSGKITEIIAYDRVLTTIEREQVEAYLNSKYEIYI